MDAIFLSSRSRMYAFSRGRLALALLLIAVIGLSSLRPLGPDVAEAQPGLYGRASTEVWTGVLVLPDDQAVPASADNSADSTAEPTDALIVRFRPTVSRSRQFSAHQTAGARRADT